MTGRGAQARRLPESDSTIAYVQADGLVSTPCLQFNEFSLTSPILDTMCYNLIFGLGGHEDS